MNTYEYVYYEIQRILPDRYNIVGQVEKMIEDIKRKDRVLDECDKVLANCEKSINLMQNKIDSLEQMVEILKHTIKAKDQLISKIDPNLP